MELKEYQTKIINNFNLFIQILKEKLKEKKDFYKFQKKNKANANVPESTLYCEEAWTELKKKLNVFSDSYNHFENAIGKNIPNVCIKLPTGGGKTLLASHTLQQIQNKFFNKNNGLVVWVVPSEAIFKQTYKNLKNKEHPIRQTIDKISAGKTLILKKNDLFEKRDTEENLVIMLLMLQSSNRKNNEFLKIFKDTGDYSSFFPEIDDDFENKKIISKINNLDTYPEDKTILIKQSLANVLKVLQPIFIIDEIHKANSELARKTVREFNPSFVLSLSATPNKDSNIIDSIGGLELKKENMIKIPISLNATQEIDWKKTLSSSFKKLLELESASKQYYSQYGKYIRPIMLIKAESQRKGSTFNHVDEIKKFLISKLGVNKEEIRSKLSSNDEIKDEDLLSELCPVKFIITKDALKEGWDCPFAYVLTILAASKSKTSTTQIIGRVLRQPYAETTPYDELNKCYIYYNRINVNDAVENVKLGLEQEGFDKEINQLIQVHHKNTKRKIKQSINTKFKNEIILIPKISVKKNNGFKRFNYISDILSKIEWNKFSYDKIDNLLNLESKDENYIQELDFDEHDDGRLKVFEKDHQKSNINQKINYISLVNYLNSIVPNPWQSYRIIHEVIEKLKKKVSHKLIISNINLIADTVSIDVKNWLFNESEKIFKKMVKNNEIFLSFFNKDKKDLVWTMPKTKEITVFESEPTINLNKNIFQPQFKSLYNDSELRIANYFEQSKKIEWWHRLAVSGEDYSIEGWRPNKVFPDFMFKLDKNSKEIKYKFVESKGNFLDNEDTHYKRSLFEVLNEINDRKIEFNLIFDDDWENSIRKITN